MIGAARNLITILNEVRLDDDAGGGAISWTTGAEIWAEVTRLNSARNLVGDSTQRLRRIAAVIRIRNDISLGQRIRFDGVDYEIVSIESDDARARRITLIGEEAA